MIVASVRGEAAWAFLLVTIIIIFGPLLAQKLRLPGLIGLLVGGAIIGPNMLGLLEDFGGLEAVGDIGVLYLIFLAGLGLDLSTFQRYRNVAITFGLITAAIPWALGIVVASLAGYDNTASVLIGSFWASFTLVSYGVVTKYGLSRNASVSATVGASSITDTIGLLALALVVGSQTGDQRGVVLILQIVLGLIVLAAYCTIIVPAIARWFFTGMGQERELRFMMILAGFTSAAVVAELLGIEPLLGAFFAGLGLNRLVPNESRLMARVDFFGNALFIPAFLVSVGLLIDPSVIFQGGTLRLAAGLAAALVVGKALAAWITGRIYRFSSAEVGLMFSLSTAQAAATLASTVIGFELGLYAEDVVNAVMVVIVLSLLISGIGAGRFGPLVKPAEQHEPRLGQVVVVPANGDVDLRPTLWLAGQVSEPDGGVVLPLSVAVADDRAALDQARKRDEELRSTVRRLGLTGDPELRVAQSISGGIAQFASERDASLVVVTWPGPSSFRSLLLGGTNEEIAAATDRPVALAAVGDEPPERIVLAIAPGDLEPAVAANARLATELASRVASASGRPLVVGPATFAELAEADIELPDGAAIVDRAERASPAGVAIQDGDLVVVPTADNPGTPVGRLVDSGVSALAIGRQWGSRQHATEGALGVTVPNEIPARDQPVEGAGR